MMHIVEGLERRMPHKAHGYLRLREDLFFRGDVDIYINNHHGWSSNRAGLTVCSRCLRHHRPSCNWGNLPSFLRYFSEPRPLWVGPPRNSERRPSSVTTLSTEMSAPVKRLLFCICITLVVLTLILNALTHLCALCIAWSCCACNTT